MTQNCVNGLTVIKEGLVLPAYGIPSRWQGRGLSFWGIVGDSSGGRTITPLKATATELTDIVTDVRKNSTPIHDSLDLILLLLLFQR